MLVHVPDCVDATVPDTVTVPVTATDCPDHDTACVAGKFETDTEPETGCVVCQNVPVTAMDELDMVIWSEEVSALICRGSIADPDTVM